MACATPRSLAARGVCGGRAAAGWQRGGGGAVLHHRGGLRAPGHSGRAAGEMGGSGAAGVPAIEPWDTPQSRPRRTGAGQPGSTRPSPKSLPRPCARAPRPLDDPTLVAPSTQGFAQFVAPVVHARLAGQAAALGALAVQARPAMSWAHASAGHAASATHTPRRAPCPVGVAWNGRARTSADTHTSIPLGRSNPARRRAGARLTTCSGLCPASWPKNAVAPAPRSCRRAPSPTPPAHRQPAHAHGRPPARPRAARRRWQAAAVAATVTSPWAAARALRAIAAGCGSRPSAARACAQQRCCRRARPQAVLGRAHPEPAPARAVVRM
jgi:hypothetical protein